MNRFRRLLVNLDLRGARDWSALRSAAPPGSRTAEVVRRAQISTAGVKPQGAGRAFLESLLVNP
jgi:hypothetical protein